MKTRENNKIETVEQLTQAAEAWVKRFFPQGLIGRKVRVTIIKKAQNAGGKDLLHRTSALVSWSKIASFTLAITNDQKGTWSFFHLEPPISITSDQSIKILSFCLAVNLATNKRKRLPILINVFPITLKGWLEFIDEPQSD